MPRANKLESGIWIVFITVGIVAGIRILAAGSRRADDPLSYWITFLAALVIGVLLNWVATSILVRLWKRDVTLWERWAEIPDLAVAFVCGLLALGSLVFHVVPIRVLIGFGSGYLVTPYVLEWGSNRWLPQLWMPVRWAVTARLRKGRADSALKIARAFHRLRRRDPASWWLLATTQRRLGNTAEAESLLREGLNTFPGEVSLGDELWFLLRYERGSDGISRKDEACQLAAELAQAKPEAPNPKVRLLQCAAAEEEWDEARRVADQLDHRISIRADAPHLVSDYLTTLLFVPERTKRALDLMPIAIAKGRATPHLRLIHGLALESREPATAKASLEAAKLAWNSDQPFEDEIEETREALRRWLPQEEA